MAVLPVCVLAAESDERLFRNPTFEELANTSVTTVTRTPVAQFTVPAAAYVMTVQDIRSSGSRNIPDALRFVPGLQVAQFDSHTWAVAARGFNTLFVDKLLVLIDGRSVYTRLWSGVNWEQHGWLDQDLDRIEVIRGPGGSAWGANAVNGVINIISKPPQDTQGLALEVGGGDEERAFGAIRYGGSFGEDAFYRVYANYQERDDFALADGRDADDAWNMARGGLRYERNRDDSHFMLKGEVHSGDFDEAKLIAAPTPPFRERAKPGSNSGVYVQTAWSHRFTPGEVRVEAWWERYERKISPSNEESDSAKLELQYRATLGAHALSTEVGYRRVDHEAIADFVFALSPEHREFDVWSASIQDEWALARTLALTAGARFEDGDFTGSHWQPNLRLSWCPDEDQMMWASIGRAVRTPSLANEGGRITLSVAPPGAFGVPSPPIVQQVIGNPAIDPEELTAYELGFRHRWPDQATLQLAAFYNDYDELITYAPQPLDTISLAPTFWRLPFLTVNAGSARAYGVELSMLWLPRPKLQFDVEVTYLNLDVDPPADPLAYQLSGSSPRWQASMRSSYELGNDWQLSASVRFVDELESLGVDSFIGADLRLARRFGEALEVALVGRDLWNKRHAEFRSGTFHVEGFVERSAFVTFAWRR